jgi:hypothetical protein
MIAEGKIMSSIIFHGALHFAGENHRPSFRIVTPYATSETVEVRKKLEAELREEIEKLKVQG